jgi:hypothetical protein
MIREQETLLILILRPLLRGDAELLVEDMSSASDILATLNDSYGHIAGEDIMEQLNNIRALDSASAPQYRNTWPSFGGSKKASWKRTSR